MLCYSATLCAYYFSVIKPLRLQRYNFFLIYANKSLFFSTSTKKSALFWLCQIQKLNLHSLTDDCERFIPILWDDYLFFLYRVYLSS